LEFGQKRQSVSIGVVGASSPEITHERVIGSLRSSIGPLGKHREALGVNLPGLVLRCAAAARPKTGAKQIAEGWRFFTSE
jgi:hypothetical protein